MVDGRTTVASSSDHPRGPSQPSATTTSSKTGLSTLCLAKCFRGGDRSGFLFSSALLPGCSCRLSGGERRGGLEEKLCLTGHPFSVGARDVSVIVTGPTSAPGPPSVPPRSGCCAACTDCTLSALPSVSAILTGRRRGSSRSPITPPGGRVPHSSDSSSAVSPPLPHLSNQNVGSSSHSSGRFRGGGRKRRQNDGIQSRERIQESKPEGVCDQR